MHLGDPIRPGTACRVIAGKRRDWLEQLAALTAWPHLPEVDCFVTAVILRVHESTSAAPHDISRPHR